MTFARLAAAAALVALAALGSPPALAQGRVLTLEEALRVAEGHPQLQSNRAQIEAARTRLPQAKSQYLPRFEANAQYQRATGNFVLSPTFANSMFAQSLVIDNSAQTFNYVLFNISLSHPIYDFGRTAGAVTQARAATDLTGAELEVTCENVLLNVRIAYFSVLANKELLVVADETLRNQERHVKQAEGFVLAGTRPKIDLSSARLAYANAELMQLRAKNALNLAKVQLNTAMGIEGPIDYDVVAPPGMGSVDTAARAQLDRLLELARRQRAEFLRLDAQILAQQGARQVASAGYAPALAATLNLSGARLEGFAPGINFYFGLGVSWNLLGGLVYYRHQVREAEAQIASLRSQETLLRQAIRAEIEQQLLSLEEARLRLQVAQRAVETATERLKFAEGRYRAGTSDIIELDDAQVGMTNAQAQLVQARYDLAVTQARLLRAVGSDGCGPEERK